MRLIVLSNGKQMLKKNIFSAFLLTLLTTICLYLLGVATVAGQNSALQRDNYVANYGDKVLYKTSEFLSEARYNYYMKDESGEIFHKVRGFINTLNNSEEFSFCSMSSQYIQLINKKVPNYFLYGYEDNYADNSIQHIKNEDLYAVKSIQVSENFFREFNIEIQKGEKFTEKDYLYKRNKTIPVLLGSSYNNVFNIGDRFQAYYLCKKINFYVKGFVNNNAFGYNVVSNTMDSCERVIIMPALTSESLNWFSRVSLLNQVTGIINSSLGGNETAAVFNNYISKLGLKGWEFNINYIGDDSPTDILTIFSSMTAEIAKQFRLLVFLIFLFSNLVTTIVLCSMIRNNFNVFGTELLCGSSRGNILSECAVVSMTILLTAFFSASLLLVMFKYTLDAIWLVLIATFCMFLVTLLIMGIFIKRMELNTFIGGKE